jgi:hypothetical protein
VNAAAADTTPDAVDWANIPSVFDFGQTAATVTGISQAISIRATLSGVSNTGAVATRAMNTYVNGVSVGTIVSGSGNSISFNVSNGQTVTFEVQCTGPQSTSITTGTVTVTNETNGGTVLDTFTYNVRSAGNL